MAFGGGAKMVVGSTLSRGKVALTSEGLGGCDISLIIKEQKLTR
jgi:hypothetical protein